MRSYPSLGLFWLAFTTYPHVHWVAPIIASIPFGAGIYFVFTSTFTYLVTAYRPIAASAMASNSALRSAFGAAFPLFAGAMYGRLGTVGATALLAGLTTIMAPLPCVLSFHLSQTVGLTGSSCLVLSFIVSAGGCGCDPSLPCTEYGMSFRSTYNLQESTTRTIPDASNTHTCRVKILILRVQVIFFMHYSCIYNYSRERIDEERVWSMYGNNRRWKV